MSAATGAPIIDQLRSLLADGDTYLAPIPRISGAPFPDFDHLAAEQIQAIALYTTNPRIAQQIAQSKGLVTTTVAVKSEAFDPPLYKFRLISALKDTVLSDFSGELKEAPISPRGFVDLMLAPNINAGIIRRDTDSVLVLRGRTASADTLKNLLMNNGLIAKSPPFSNFALRVSEDGNGFLAAASIPTPLADAILRAGYSNINLLEAGAKTSRKANTLNDVLQWADAQLEAVAKAGGVDAVRSNGQQSRTVPPTPIKPLAEWIADLPDAAIALFQKRELDGSLRHQAVIHGLPRGWREAVQDSSKSSPALRSIGVGRITALNDADYQQLAKPEYVGKITRSDRIEPFRLNDRMIRSVIARASGSAKDTFTAELQQMILLPGDTPDKVRLYIVANRPEWMPAWLERIDMKPLAASTALLSLEGSKPVIHRIEIPRVVAEEMAAAVPPHMGRIIAGAAESVPDITAGCYRGDWPKERIEADEALKQRPIVRIPLLINGLNAPVPNPDAAITESLLAAEVARQTRIKGQLKGEQLDNAADVGKKKPVDEELPPYNKMRQAEKRFLTDLRHKLGVEESHNKLTPAAVVFERHERMTGEPPHPIAWIEPRLLFNLHEEIANPRVAGKRKGHTIIEDMLSSHKALRSTASGHALKKEEDGGRGLNAYHRYSIHLSPEMLVDLQRVFPSMMQLTNDGPIPLDSQHGLDLLDPALQRISVMPEQAIALYNQYHAKLVADAAIPVSPEIAAYQFLAKQQLLKAVIRHPDDTQLVSISRRVESVTGAHDILRQAPKDYYPKLAQQAEPEAIDHAVGSLHGMMAGLKDMATTMTRQHASLEKQVGQIAECFANYQKWVQALGANRQVPALLLVDADGQAIRSLQPLRRLMRCEPELLPRAAGKGRNVVVIYPQPELMTNLETMITAAERTRIARHADIDMTPDKLDTSVVNAVNLRLESLGDHAVAAESLYGAIRQHFEPAPRQRYDYRPDRAKEVAATINGLQSALSQSKPYLALIRQQPDQPHIRPLRRMEEPQYALLFALDPQHWRRDVERLEKIQQQLKDHHLLAPPKIFGNVFTDHQSLEKIGAEWRGLNAQYTALHELIEACGDVPFNVRHLLNEGTAAEYNFEKLQQANLGCVGELATWLWRQTPADAPDRSMLEEAIGRFNQGLSDQLPVSEVDIASLQRWQQACLTIITMAETKREWIKRENHLNEGIAERIIREFWSRLEEEAVAKGDASLVRAITQQRASMERVALESILADPARIHQLQAISVVDQPYALIGEDGKSLEKADQIERPVPMPKPAQSYVQSLDPAPVNPQAYAALFISKESYDAFIKLQDQAKYFSQLPTRAEGRIKPSDDVAAVFDRPTDKHTLPQWIEAAKLHRQMGMGRNS